MSYDGPERRTEPRVAEALTSGEIAELRRIIESERRMRWLWSTIRNIAVWIVAVITGVTVGYQAISDVVKGLGK